jgi:hypothetical protein
VRAGEDLLREILCVGAAYEPRQTIAIVADLRERECFRTNIAPEVVERMKGPLARARKTLDELAGTGAAAGTF